LSRTARLMFPKYAAKQSGEEVDARPRDHHSQLAAIIPMDVLGQVEGPLSGPPVLNGTAYRKRGLLPLHLLDEVVSVSQIDGSRGIGPRIIQNPAIIGDEGGNVDAWQFRDTRRQPLEKAQARDRRAILLLVANIIFRDPVEHGVDDQMVDREALLGDFCHDKRKVRGRSICMIHADIVRLPEERTCEQPDGNNGDQNSHAHPEQRARPG